MVKFKVSSQELQGAIDKALEQVDDLRPAFIQMAREFYKANRAIFRLKGPGLYTDFVGPKIANTWKNPGRPEKRIRNGNYTAYQWHKEKTTKLQGGYPLLKFTGLLEKSITRETDQNTVRVISRKSLVVGTRVEYGIYHQSDEPRSSNLPMRKFLFIDPSTTAFAGAPEFSRRNTAWKKAIEKYVERVLAPMQEGKK